VLEPLGSADEAPLETSPPGRKTMTQQVTLAIFVFVPLLALVAAIPVAWGWGLSLRDVVIFTVMYAWTGLGVTVGFHRYLTHRAFRAKKPVHVLLVLAGSMAVEASPIQWVADHRRHHRFSDRDGDPHSPWRYGTGFRAVTKGFFYSHVGWLFDWDKTSEEQYAPELLADGYVSWISRHYVLMVTASLLIPAVIGGLWAWSWYGALTAFFWGSLVRICLIHHVTFSINSVCHITGRKPFKTRDQSTNVWWLAIPSFGESWHNFHHAEPKSARHGVRRYEIDFSAWVIRAMEKARCISDVRWPSAAQIARRLAV
jgi:stearoyl-CoA desaturase (delta-9 desaturase)